jgi:hypothetical protein
MYPMMAERFFDIKSYIVSGINSMRYLIAVSIMLLSGVAKRLSKSVKHEAVNSAVIPKTIYVLSTEFA